MTRETHVKALDLPVTGTLIDRLPRVVLTIAPELHVEPTLSYYLRRVLAFRFIRRVLTRALGSDGLAGLRRLTADGPVSAPLADELAEVEGLFLGAAACVAEDLGLTLDEAMDPAFHEVCTLVGVRPQDDATLGSGRGRAHDAEAFRRWTPATDPDVGRDARMMVPVFYDVEREKVKVWVFLGWTRERVVVGFERPPLARVTTADGQKVSSHEVHVQFGVTEYESTYPVMAEVYVNRLLNRKEMQVVCDKHRTRTAILAALSGLCR